MPGNDMGNGDDVGLGLFPSPDYEADLVEYRIYLDTGANGSFVYL